MSLSRIWWIKQIEEGVIHWGQRSRHRKYPPNTRSRCHPPSCLLAVFAMFVAITSPSFSCSSYSWNKWNVRHFFFHNQNNSTSSPGLLDHGTLTCSGLHFLRHFLIKHKILPNLVISNWLWWIMHVHFIQIFWMNNDKYYYSFKIFPHWILIG